jgi:hypothetical protein
MTGTVPNTRRIKIKSTTREEEQPLAVDMTLGTDGGERQS